MEKLVIIPTYNEKENIAAILTSIYALNKNYHVLVVDDNSPDGTGTIVKELMHRYEGCLFLEIRKQKSGLGTAYIHGFRWAVSRGYQYIFEMDADFSHNPSDLEKLYEACAVNNADVSIGSRYVPGGRIENWPLGQAYIFQGGCTIHENHNKNACKRSHSGFCLL